MINDNHGHAKGDEVLMDFAATLTRNTRNCDLGFRVGGEEFLLVLPSTLGESALLLAERIRKDWANRTIMGTIGIIHSTASFGVCEMSGPTDLDALLGRVDQALYQAKEMGRNMCRLAPAVEAASGAVAGEDLRGK
jgi:diguanylate cyclase